MNTTEQKAFNWLLTQGYTNKDIVFQKRETPDFLTSDNKGYEVKLLYGNVVWLYNNQIEELYNMDNTFVIVFDKNKKNPNPVSIIPSKKLKENKIIDGIKIVRYYTDKEQIKEKEITNKNLKEFFSIYETEKNKEFIEFISSLKNFILSYTETHETLIESEILNKWIIIASLSEYCWGKDILNILLEHLKTYHHKDLGDSLACIIKSWYIENNQKRLNRLKKGIENKINILIMDEETKNNLINLLYK